MSDVLFPYRAPEQPWKYCLQTRCVATNQRSLIPRYLRIFLLFFCGKDSTEGVFESFPCQFSVQNYESALCRQQHTDYGILNHDHLVIVNDTFQWKVKFRRQCRFHMLQVLIRRPTNLEVCAPSFGCLRYFVVFTRRGCFMQAKISWVASYRATLWRRHTRSSLVSWARRCV